MTAADFDLLPPNATPYERGLARGTRRLIDVPTPIAEAFRPYDTPASVLPFLAWERSVDIWNNDWPEATKRNVTARAFPLHKRKGTAYAIREYVRYAGGSVREIITPPQKVFSGASMSREAREAWLEKLPQVRAWRIQERAPAPAQKAFYGGQRHAHFVENSFSIPSDALSRLRRRVRWVVDEEETETTVTEFGNYFRLHIRAPAGRRVFSGGVMGSGKFFIPSDARKRLVTIQPTPQQPWRSALGPTLQPVTAEPERVVQRRTGGGGVFSGGFCGVDCFVPSTAPQRIFERYAVNDGSSPARPPAVQIMGTGRYGFPAHTAHISVSIPGKKPRRQAGDGIIEPRTKFWIPSTAKARVDRVRAAIVAAKRLSDKIMIWTGPEQKFIAGNVFLAGENFIVGRPN